MTMKPTLANKIPPPSRCAGNLNQKLQTFGRHVAVGQHLIRPLGGRLENINSQGFFWARLRKHLEQTALHQL